MKKQDAQSIGEIIDRVLKEQNLDLNSVCAGIC